MLIGWALSDELQHALPGQEQGQRHDEARDADLGHQVAVQDADGGADADGGDQGQEQVLGQVGGDQEEADRHDGRPGPGLQPDRHRDGDHEADHQAPVEGRGQRLVEVAREHRLGGERCAGAACGAGRQVDLTEEQHEHQAQRDDRDVGALAGQVADVVLRQEAVADLHEDQGEDDEAEHRRQRARVSAPAACDPARDRVGDRALLDVEGEPAGAIGPGHLSGVDGRSRVCWSTWRAPRCSRRRWRARGPCRRCVRT